MALKALGLVGELNFINFALRVDVCDFCFQFINFVEEMMIAGVAHAHARAHASTCTCTCT